MTIKVQILNLSNPHKFVNVTLSKCYIVVVIFTGNESWGKNADLLYITDI
jgi:hypothetical protein